MLVACLFSIGEAKATVASEAPARYEVSFMVITKRAMKCRRLYLKTVLRTSVTGRVDERIPAEEVGSS